MAGNGLNPFDYAMELKKLGMPADQADLQAKAFAYLVDHSAATKQNLEIAKLELKRAIEETKAELKRDIEETRGELKRDIEETRGELKRDIEETRRELKRDIVEVKAEMQRTTEKLRAELKRDIKELGFKMTIAFGSVSVIILGSLVALAKLGLLTPPT